MTEKLAGLPSPERRHPRGGGSAFQWLKNVLFGEPTLGMPQEVLQGAIANARAEVGGPEYWAQFAGRRFRRRDRGPFHAALQHPMIERVDLGQCANRDSSYDFYPPKEEGRMLAVPDGQKNRSPIQAVLQWCRDWMTGNSQLKCCGEETVERMARDVGVSASELRRLASLGPDSADLLLRRMKALDLDPNEVSRATPEAFRDLQRTCSMCESHRRCARDLARDSAVPVWKDYCPNAATLVALNALPWSSRHEW